jgi:hypothetical protein
MSEIDPNNYSHVTSEETGGNDAVVSAVTGVAENAIVGLEAALLVNSMSDNFRSSKEGQQGRLNDIAHSLNAGESVLPITVREFLSWFWWSQRRGRFIVSYIRERLAEADLTTVPDFEATYLDGEISFAIASKRVIEFLARLRENKQEVEVASIPEAGASPILFADPTYRVSKLAAANKKAYFRDSRFASMRSDNPNDGERLYSTSSDA